MKSELKTLYYEPSRELSSSHPARLSFTHVIVLGTPSIALGYTSWTQADTKHYTFYGDLLSGTWDVWGRIAGHKGALVAAAIGSHGNRTKGEKLYNCFTLLFPSLKDLAAALQKLGGKDYNISSELSEIQPGIGLMASQQFSGVNTVMLYAVEIFRTV
ncbi:hypothetical protein SELMODRAFT_415765 [Selaginella moellendorffii]|uniref:Uncharacterized protein n=1 Tax=Selaginella moellendorffii TaxID=88036 RepID=D8RX62_SELML|nr:hypothetical protein SELMODRAFT_415765 [Selaginella moellendorffii]